MLIKCPECELQVSDKAKVCPHCGFPIAQRPDMPFGVVKTQHRAKHMRLPNGFGQITKISGNLRNPYRVMVTVGKNDVGKPICKLLKPQSYYPTYNDAYKALVEYNKNPYSLDNEMTVAELYEKWFKEYNKKLSSSSSARTIESAWNYCTELYKVRVRDIRARHIKSCMEKAPSENISFRIKSLFNLMLDYALEYELVDKNYARSFTIEKKEETKSEHIAFTPEEIEILWKNVDIPYVDMILIQCYSGWRPQELCLLETSNISNVMIGGMKTKAGTNRKVPIVKCIEPLIKKRLCEKDKYLFYTENHEPLTYDMYRRRFDKVISILKLNPKHRAHDPRKTFATLCKNEGVDEYAIKYLMGHSIYDLTEKVYTERNEEWLFKEIEKINRDCN